MNSILLVVATVLLCSVGSGNAFFFLSKIIGRARVCNNLTALDVNWEEVIQPLNNWNLFYMNYYEPSFYEQGKLSTCIQINYTATATNTSESRPDDIIGKFTATKLTTSKSGKNKQLRYISLAIADVQKTCNNTWTVSIPEKDILSRVTMPIYNRDSKFFCLAKCNNKCDDIIGQENGALECYGQNKQAAVTFKQQYPKLARDGRFLTCSLES